MKNIYYIALSLACLTIVGFSGCENFLSEPVYTQPTSQYLVSSPEGMASTVTAMYYKDRELLRSNSDSESELYLILMMGDDITVPRSGEGIPQFGRCANLMSSNKFVANYWKQNYAMIGYANTVIGAMKNVDSSSPIAQQAEAEAKVFRAHAYLRLIQRYDNIYLTTTAATPENINDPVIYTPASPDSVYALIYRDLEDAVAVLPLTTSSPGRFTRGVARHIWAKAALHHHDWATAAEQVDSIEASRMYALLDQPWRVFDGADLNHSEAILVSQWAKAIGGWYTNTTTLTNNGHRISLHFTPNYNQEAGMAIDFPSGGYPWGRLFPNTYLASLYDQANDRRYNDYYKYAWVYNNEQSLPRGKHLGDTLVAKSNAQYLNVHPMCTKYMDSWTKANANDAQSFKDVIVYRLAETYLMGCEAYWHLNRMDKALDYFNRTYTRAGNPSWTGALSLQDIADEHARELAMEGDRWNFLKREEMLLSAVRAHGGEYLVNDKGVELMADTAIRINIQEHNVRWPIPLAQLEIMGKSFPQNPGY